MTANNQQEMQSTLTLTYEDILGLRRKDLWIDELTVILDGKKLRKIRLGKTHQYECEAGTHTLQVSMGWGLESQEVSFFIQPGEVVTFKCSRNNSWKIKTLIHLPMFLGIYLTLMVSRHFYSTLPINTWDIAAFVMPMILIVLFRICFFKCVPGMLFLYRD